MLLVLTRALTAEQLPRAEAALRAELQRLADVAMVRRCCPCSLARSRPSSCRGPRLRCAPSCSADRRLQGAQPLVVLARALAA
jgi:hypothetical protein